MGRKRQTFSKNFKARVVLEALREESTIQEIDVKHGVHPNQVSQWKSQAIAGMEDIFERPNKKSQEVLLAHPYYGYRRVWREIDTIDGKGRALDNIRMERLWRSLKYEDIYLKLYETMGEPKSGVSAYFNFYNSARFHQSLDYSVPDEMYESFQYNGLEYKQAV